MHITLCSVHFAKCKTVIHLSSSGKPSKPEGPLEALDVQRSSITLRWKPPKDDGGSPLTAYIIEKRDVGRGTSWTKAGKVEAGVTETSLTDLIENTDYHFRVIAVNKAGQSEPLETKEAITVKSPFGKL